MTWHWFSFFVGAPIWASVGIAVFAAVLSAGTRAERRSAGLAARIARKRREAEDPGIICLSEHRIARMRHPAPLHGHPAGGRH